MKPIRNIILLLLISMVPGIGFAAVINFTNANFTMINPGGLTFGGTNDVAWNFDNTTLNTAETGGAGDNFQTAIASLGSTPFFGFPWSAHDVRVFSPGTYYINTGCSVASLQAGTCACTFTGGTTTIVNVPYAVPTCDEDGSPALKMTVGAGQLGAHMLFDWNLATNIDVVLVWDQAAVWSDANGQATSPNNLYLGPDGTTLAPDPLGTWSLVSTDDEADGYNGVRMVDGPFLGYSANFNFGPGGTIVAASTQELTAQDTQVGGAGCSLRTKTSTPFQSVDWLLVLGFIIWMGSMVYRRNSTQ